MSDPSPTEISRFLKIVHELRQQCPWDRKQTHESLAPYLLEETYEVLEAIESGGRELKGELGDLLLQIVLHAEIASETDQFDFEQVAKAVSDKMVARHPHVYGDVNVADADEVKSNWLALKKKEKPNRALLGDIPKALPSLQLAYKYGYRAASVGFDWENAKAVWAKVQEEMGELEEELGGNDPSRLEEELGDLLFALANLGRKLKIDPETALRKANEKFGRRIAGMEKSAQDQNKPLDRYSLSELEGLWEQAKLEERR